VAAKLFVTGHAGTDMDRSVQLTLRHGVEAKNYDDVSCTVEQGIL